MPLLPPPPIPCSTTLVSTDVLRVSLPGFTGLASSSLRHTDARPASAPPRLFRLSWAPSAQRLTVTLTNGSIPTRSPVSLTFTGLWLPTDGLSANDPSLALTANARNLTCAQGVVACVRTYTNATPILTSPAVRKATGTYPSPHCHVTIPFSSLPPFEQWNSIPTCVHLTFSHVLVPARSSD